MKKFSELQAEMNSEQIARYFKETDFVFKETDFVINSPAAPSESPPTVEGGTKNTGGGCTMASPGRGDCEHHIGLPGLVHGTLTNNSTTDEYGKPNGWCWSCWKGYQIDKLHRQAEFSARREKEAVDTIAKLRVDACFSKTASDKLSASEALYGFMGWLTSRDAEVTFSGHHNAGVAIDLIRDFRKVNEMDEPRSGWDKNLTHPTRIVGGNTPIAQACVSAPEIHCQTSGWGPPIMSAVLNLAEEALSKLSGDLNYDNVAEAKAILKKLL